jgi:hypothetical protein
MTRTFTATLLMGVLMVRLTSGQVNEIKSASSTPRKSSEIRQSGSGTTTNAFAYNFLFQLMFTQVVQWQQQKLQRREDVPSMVSLDVMFQSAVQPSNYYIINPRIRGNWGLFSTDFRINFIIEEDIDGPKHIRTNDWQILQVNLVTTRNVTARVGGGIIQEAYNDRDTYPEWTGALQFRPITTKVGGTIEYRGSEARKEANAHIQYALFTKRQLHGYLTAGVVFQQYYSKVNLWGIQGGITFSVF